MTFSIMYYVTLLFKIFLESNILTIGAFYLPKNKLNKNELTMILITIFIVEVLLNILDIIGNNHILYGFHLGSGAMISYKLLK